MQRNLSMVGQVDLFLCLDLLARSFIFLIETPFTLYWDSLRRSAVASVTPRGGVTENLSVMWQVEASAQVCRC